MRKKYVCVHGHFYQPPRENPWLEDVEVQDSAHPFHDWNERVAFECYAPNTASRVLDAQGRIVDLVNNYRLISFNFGPTLLSWLERRAPDVHDAIVEADRLSVLDRGGHGNAIAQVYNHVIMPLASRRDKVTQVRWGIADFRRRFGRAPEGMWLAETAVDSETLEILADHGILFTVLSPSQAARVRPAGKAEWADVGGGRIDPSRAYKWTSPAGKSVALFFYDAPISRGVAFEGLLNSGDVFARRILGGFAEGRDHDQLVHIATDGESYGHHHRFGDMALARALQVIRTGGEAVLTNYGEYLSLHPPEREVEIVEKSAWSCAHGVERWNADCGCRIGAQPGWSQAWRAPLRAALDGLRDGLDALYEKAAAPLLKDPWAARDAYVDAVLDRQKTEAFLAGHAARALSAAERAAAVKLLEMQRQRLLMFTSCAWFFDELSGIETVAVLCFAARAIQLARDHAETLSLEQAFLADLAKARSNLPALGDGEQVYRRFVSPVITDLPRVAAHEAIESLFRDRGGESALYCYVLRHEEAARAESDGHTVAVGRLEVRSTLTGESFRTSYAAIHLGGHDIQCVLKTFPDEARHAEVKAALLDLVAKGSVAEILGFLYKTFDDHVYSLHDLLLEDRRRMLAALSQDVLGRYDPIYRGLVDDNRKLIRMMDEIGMPVPPAFRLALEYVLGQDVAILTGKLARGGTPVEEVAGRLVTLREEAKRWGLPVDWEEAARRLRNAMEDRMADLGGGAFRPERARELIALLDAAARMDVPMNLWRVENLFFALSRAFRRLSGDDFLLVSALGERLRFPPLTPLAE